jgi:signal transduction histidine kinase/DNA-binding NarL/FixJ family response regulator
MPGVAAAVLIIFLLERRFRDRRLLAIAEARLDVERAHVETLMQQIPAGAMIVDAPSARLTAVNEIARSILGHDVEIGHKPLEYFESYAFQADGSPYPPDRHPLARALRHGDTTVGEEIHYVAGDASQVILLVGAAPVRDRDRRIIAGLLVFTNATDRRQLEAMLAQSQRLEALGRLVGGVAHDFNNLLTVIIGYAELLWQQPPSAENASHILRCARQAASLTQQLLAFGRHQVLHPDTIDVNAVIESIMPMLRRVVGEHVELVVHLRDGSTTVHIDAGQLEQVISNLVANAADAMPIAGTLLIETSTVDFDAAQSHERLPVGRCVVLTVSDTGAGMDRETQARIFEPFFTTKQLGHGAGLGLATVYEIVRRSGGTIWVSSEPGKGATFKVYLPATDDAPQAIAGDIEAGPLPGGIETILLVEDEDSVRRIAADVLRRAGYTVVDCRNADEAVARASEVAQPIQLLLTDVVMAGGSGPSLSGTLHTDRPEMRTLFMSGYSDAMVAQHGVPFADAAFLQKPFSPATLLRAVRATLDQGQSADSGWPARATDVATDSAAPSSDRSATHDVPERSRRGAPPS